MKKILVFLIILAFFVPAVSFAKSGDWFSHKRGFDLGTSDLPWDNIYLDNGSIIIEGDTIDDYETTLDVNDPTADRRINLPDYSGDVVISTLSGNKPGVANSVWFSSNALAFEGATADAYTTSLVAADPTAINTITLPDSSGTVMLSSLATNAADVANSVTGASNALLFEGATADTSETSLTVEDPTGDRTITLPDYTGGVPLVIQSGFTATTQSGVGSSDVTGSSLTISAGWFTAGKVLEWKLSGDKTGSGDFNLHFYLDVNEIMTLNPSPSASGAWVAKFTMYEHTGTANQIIIGECTTEGGDTEVGYAATTYDMSASMTAKVKLEIPTGSEGDTVTVRQVTIKTWKKE